MKTFDLKPEDNRKVRLFGTKAEAIVFWLAVAGLIFLGIISLFRYFAIREMEIGEAQQRNLETRIEQLETLTQTIELKLDSLARAGQADTTESGDN